MLRFTEKPYVFRKARPSRLIYVIATWINRVFTLPGERHRISRIELSRSDRVAKMREDPDARLIFVANHSTHSDVEVLMEAQRRCRLWGAFMAAHEVFARNPIQAWVMQKMGAFSVNRENVDRSSIKEGVRIAKDKRYCLSLFPEGNVAFTNEQVMPFLDGGSFLALRAQRELKGDAKVYVVPVAIRVTHIKDVRELLRRQLADLVEQMKGEGMEVKIDDAMPFHRQLEVAGYAVLCRGLERRGYEHPGTLESWNEDPNATLEAVTEQILGDLENEMEIEGKGSVAERSRVVRSQLAKMRLEANGDTEQIDRWDNQSILLLRLQTYGADYLRDRPSVDRCSETLEKLREDMTDILIRPESTRHAWVHFGEPIALEGQRVTELTEQLEGSVGAGLAEFASNSAGSEMMEIAG